MIGSMIQFHAVITNYQRVSTTIFLQTNMYLLLYATYFPPNKPILFLHVCIKYINGFCERETKLTKQAVMDNNGHPNNNHYPITNAKE